MNIKWCTSPWVLSTECWCGGVALLGECYCVLSKRIIRETHSLDGEKSDVESDEE